MAFPISLACDHMEELVIIGGGVGGLSCMNALLDQQISPLLLEAHVVGAPKLCGEFLAPPAMALLAQWGVGPVQQIHQVKFIGDKPSILQCEFPHVAGGYSRYEAEVQLLARAQGLGGRIREKTPIKTIIPATQTTPHTLYLDSGEVIQARHLMIAGGRFSSPTHSTVDYVGFKTHIPKIFESETLLMFGLLDGYLGIVPISSHLSNLTCLMKADVIAKAGSCSAFLTTLIHTHPILKSYFDETHVTSQHWLEGISPGFGFKTIPPWPKTYWVGDAFASVHPAIGFGFAHSIISAKKAVNHYLQDNPNGYHQFMKKQMRIKHLVGKSMHHVLQKPSIHGALIPLLERYKGMTHQLLNLLDY